MPGISSITNAWNNLKEIDLRPIRDEALKIVKIAVVGAPDSGRDELVEQMRRDPLHPDMFVQSPLLVLGLENGEGAAGADLILLVLSSAQEAPQLEAGPIQGGQAAQTGAPSTSFYHERVLARSWAATGKKLLVVVNQPAELGKAQAFGPWVEWGQVVYGNVNDEAFLLERFAPAVIDLLPDQLLSLGRHFPLFRVPIARRMISETSVSNATYALSTGLAEIVPIFDIPLNVADMVVLTKTQAFLVYKLGLALGLSTNWQDYVAEFGSVLGGGFLWRQVARSLIGLIPAWGIIPKVAVAYSGTQVVGNVVLQWYLTGRHLSPQQMKQLTESAFARGRKVAKSLSSRRPRLALPSLKRKKKARVEALPPGEIILPAEKQPAAPAARTCPSCGRQNAADARFCQYCAQPLAGSSTPA